VSSLRNLVNCPCGERGTYAHTDTADRGRGPLRALGWSFPFGADFLARCPECSGQPRLVQPSQLNADDWCTAGSVLCIAFADDEAPELGIQLYSPVGRRIVAAPLEGVRPVTRASALRSGAALFGLLGAA
jgi:hypothetical protein